jgi:hypothetical protein
MRVLRAIAASVCLAAILGPVDAWAQNDWQYPDPYFGILEIEKSRTALPARHGAGPAVAGPRPRTASSRPRVFRPRQRTAAGVR